MSHTVKILIILVSFLLTSFLHSQNIDLENFKSSYYNDEYKEALSELSKIDTVNISTYDKATWHFYYADVQSILDEHGIAYTHARKAESLFKTLNKLSDEVDSKFLILSIVAHQNSLEFDEESLIDDILSYALKENDSTALMKIYFRIGHTFTNNDNRKKAIFYYRKILDETKDTLDIAHAYMSIGTAYNTIPLEKPDSALYYTKKAVPILFKLKKSQITNTLASNYNNQAKAYALKNDYEKAIEYFKKADSIPLKENIAKTKIIFYKNMGDTFVKAEDFQSATLYLNKYIKLNDSINDKAQNEAIAEAKEYYKNAELKVENASTNTKLTISLAILFLVIISAYLIQKNTRKKQLLAEQAKDLEAQKVSTLLKEQELSSIDAMIEGQEKERKRIAEDLHDDLGALMATVKLHFDNIESAQNEEAVTKTSSLLDEAYEKIRSIAHAKNSGVIANQGLLVAVTNMASKISSANTINIEVIAHGLEERLENSLELSLFRMIQELIANIIKHSEATNATIQLTQHEKNLNIIVEDNGKGFEFSNYKSSGIGLETIKKRIEHLNGTLTIDSSLGKGTTILVDIPLT